MKERKSIMRWLGAAILVGLFGGSLLITVAAMLGSDGPLHSVTLLFYY